MKKVTALLILLIGLLQYKLWFGEGNVREFKRMNDRIAELRQEGAKRRERNAALEAEVMDLKQGLDAVEERARHELGMVMEEEEFVQVIDPQQEPQPSTTTPTPEKPNASDKSPDVGKSSKKEKTHQKQMPKETVTPKSTESHPPSANRKATAAKRNPSNPQAEPKKTTPRAKPTLKPIDAEQPTPEPTPQPQKEEADQ